MQLCYIRNLTCTDCGLKVFENQLVYTEDDASLFHTDTFMSQLQCVK